MAHHVSRRLALMFATLILIVGIPVGIVLASHQFGDVPTTHPFHGDISAVADSGVTSGCGGGNYCPDRNVTRAEMAAFLNRLGALAANKTPVVNADKLDGLNSTDFAPASTTLSIGIHNGVGNHAGCASGTLAVAITNANGQGVDHRFTMQVPGPTPAYAQIRANASIRNGSANVTSVTHTAGSGVFCVGFSVVIGQAELESAVVSLHGTP